MTLQNKRISDFVSNLFDGDLADAQCAVILGDDGTQLRGTNSSNCVNYHESGCTQNSATCVNYGDACGDSKNSKICSNAPMPPNTNFVSILCGKKP